MHLNAAVVEFFYSKDFTTDSNRFYRRTLDAFQSWAEQQDATTVEDLTSPLLRRYLAHLREQVSARTGKPLTGVSQHGYANALRTFLHFCAREEWLNERIPARLEMPKQEKKVLNVLSTDQLQRLLRATAGTATPLRDRAIVLLLAGTSLRVSELGRLTLDAVHCHTNDAWLVLHGKGRKQREVPLERKVRVALHRYLYMERHAPSSERHVLLGKRGPLTQAGIDGMLYDLRDAAGAQHFTGVRVSAHMLRHTFAVRYLDAGGDIYKLARLLGHGSVAITERYLQAFTA